MRLNRICVMEYRFMLAVFALLFLALSQSSIPANSIYPLGNKEILLEPDIYIGKGRFGCSVATNGKIIVVGAEAYRKDKGIAFVYEPSGQKWPQSGRLRNPSGKKHDSFGQSVDVSGVGYIAVGAPGADIRKENAGKVVVYKKKKGEWKATATLTANDASENAEFGAAVSFSGSYLVVGAPGVPCVLKCCNNNGAVYVFRHKGNKWKQVAKIPYDCMFGWNGSRYGHSVAIDGDTIVVGAPGIWGGRIWIHKQIGQEKWKKLWGGKIDDDNEKLGWSVDVFGNRIVVGDPGYKDHGRAWILERPPGGDWYQRNEKVTPQDPPNASNFGNSVSIAGSKILVGDPGSHESRGSVDRWKRPGKKWRFDKTYTSKKSNKPGNSFGRAVDNGLKIQVIGVPGYKEGRGLVIIKK